jgi:hypothetical protein
MTSEEAVRQARDVAGAERWPWREPIEVRSRANAMSTNSPVSPSIEMRTFDPFISTLMAISQGTLLGTFFLGTYGYGGRQRQHPCCLANLVEAAPRRPAPNL